MQCPDDDTYARFLQGLLPADEQRQLEAHLDGCPACMELLTELGRAYAEVHATHGDRRTVTRTARSSRWASGDARELAGIEVFGLLVHLLVTGKLLWLASRDWAAVLFVSPLHWFAPGTVGVVCVVTCMLLCGPVGLIAASASCWGTIRGRAWASKAAGMHALLAVPTVLLSPLAIYVLTRYWRSAP